MHRRTQCNYLKTNVHVWWINMTQLVTSESSWNSKSSVNHIKIPKSYFPRRLYPCYSWVCKPRTFFFFVIFFFHLLSFTKPKNLGTLEAMADKFREPGKSKRSSAYSVLWPLSAEVYFLFPFNRPLKATEQSVLLFYQNHLELQKLYYKDDRQLSGT